MDKIKGEERNPSVYTLNFLIKMENKIDELKKSVNDLRVDIALMPERIFEKCDTRYANKLAEKVIYGMVGVILTSVLAAVLYFVFE